MRRPPNASTAILAALLLAGPAAWAAPAPAADPVLASVNGVPIRLSDLQRAANDLPSQMQQAPPEQLFPFLLNQQIDRRALLVAARKEKLENKADVAAAMQEAADEKLENAYVQQQAAPAVSEAAILAAYKKDYDKPGAEQVDARHILLKTKEQAEAVIAQLNKGADFAKLATADSVDPGAKNGGELGWFSQNEMVPAFSAAAFALKPGQYTKTPVQSQFGWHVILSEGRRQAPPPALADVHDEIRQSLGDNAIKTILADARSKVKVVVNAPPPGAAPPAAGAPASPAAPAPAQ